jgi:hypothetical protein
MRENRFSKHRKVRQFYADRLVKVVYNRCDICDYRLVCQDDIESKIDMQDEINASYLDEYDMPEPRLLLCDYCQKEYMIQGYQLT